MITKKLPLILLGIYLIFFIALAIKPFDRSVWMVENFLSLFTILLIISYKKFRFSNISYLLVFYFLIISTIGGHYSYELVPFDFFNSLLEELNLEFLFATGRNNFDRFVHLSVGVFAYPIAELIYCKKYVKTVFIASFFAVISVGCWAAVYEIIETIYAVVDGGEVGMAFLGSQGDIWDAQKDMLLNIIGGIFFATLFFFTNKNKQINDNV